MSEIPYHDIAAFAYGALGWDPDQFWRSTPHDINTAVHGYRLTNDSEYAKEIEFERFKESILDG